MEPKTGKLALITGASTGIGYELARQFAQNGFDILITSQDPERLAEAKKLLEVYETGVESVAADLTKPAGVETLFEKFKSLNRPLDAAALNAGIGVYGAFKDTELDEEINLIELNVVSVVRLAKRVVREMVSQGEGRILFTASVAATMPGPLMAIYHASKAFVLSFAEGLREELKETGVTVTALMPGATETEFFRRAEMEHTKVGTMKKQTAAEVAEVGFKALMKDKDHVVSGFSNKIQTAIGEILPEVVKAKQMHAQTKPDPKAAH